ncbi:regulatory protein [Lederbergia galactosidilyticus]|uniref:recombination regulator RecX n=1 Tax=Lederbergia galactosidilytica TaxID=217031 RepID=UPI001AEB5780|nr:recombination regulator RecX [Lederbergia galactosidilytica]MBP1916513.1 regulatory protein [Lederbergia galactosidilytica]
MAIITKITAQKKRADRYNLFLDEKYAFSVDEAILIRYGLVKGKELADFEVIQLQYEDEIRKAYNEAIHYLSFRMRAEGEIKDHLAKKDWNIQVIEQVMQKLHEHQYVDDLEFAKAFVRTQISAGKKGPYNIKQELLQKAISDSNIEEALSLYKKEDQIEHAIQLGNKYAAKNKKLSEKILKQKLENFLQTKGFSFAIISVAIEEIDFEKDEDEEWQTLLKHGEKAQRKYQHLDGFEYRQKMKQALFRKGFELDMIDRFLDENE